MKNQEKADSIVPTLVAGIKQVIRGINENRIISVTLALNADEFIKNQINMLCSEKAIPVSFARSKEELGRQAGIEVSCSVTGMKK